jgi:hypothetical protein
MIGSQSLNDVINSPEIIGSKERILQEGEEKCR